MKRTNLVLDEQLLEQAVQVLGVRTYSAAVNQSLADTVRRSKVESLSKFFGTQLWEGDLAEMRDDQPLSAQR